MRNRYQIQHPTIRNVTYYQGILWIFAKGQSTLTMGLQFRKDIQPTLSLRETNNDGLSTMLIALRINSQKL